jgi:hypothetical protein
LSKRLLRRRDDIRARVNQRPAGDLLFAVDDYRFGLRGADIDSGCVGPKNTLFPVPSFGLMDRWMTGLLGCPSPAPSFSNQSLQ